MEETAGETDAHAGVVNPGHFHARSDLRLPHAPEEESMSMPRMGRPRGFLPSSVVHAESASDRWKLHLIGPRFCSADRRAARTPSIVAGRNEQDRLIERLHRGTPFSPQALVIRADQLDAVHVCAAHRRCQWTHDRGTSVRGAMRHEHTRR